MLSLKRVTTALLIGCLANYAFAQSESQKPYKFQFGLTGGTQFTGISIQLQPAGPNYGPINDNKSKSRTSYHFGIPTRVTKNKHSLSARFLFTKDKTQTTNNYDFVYSTIIIDHTYKWVSIPVTYNYLFAQKSKQRFFVGIGITPRRLLTVTAKVTTLQNTSKVSGPEIDNSDTYKTWAWFGEVLIGADLIIAKHLPLTVTFAFDQGLTNLVKESSRTNSNLVFDYGFIQPDISMKSAALSLSYFLR